MLPVAGGRRRSPAAVAGYHAGRPPWNKGCSYPADPRRSMRSWRCPTRRVHVDRGQATFVADIAAEVAMRIELEVEDDQTEFEGELPW
jgi:hypothetical protein